MGQRLGPRAVLLRAVSASLVTGPATLPGLERGPETVQFEPKRTAGIERLDRFVSRAGRAYARQRNYDFGRDQRINVSALSPWIRHRLITEEEVLRATLARHAPSAAEKFIQEVFWRTYFKGWLEQRPTVWDTYQSGLEAALQQIDQDRAMAMDYQDAVAGRIGIDGFDQWAQELVTTGYMHNHARMWFASIWIFTLRLPWQLGADFFLRHLLDGDPASNTLSWRWVAGLHTKGKAYKASVSNIAKYTEGRFRPLHQLANTIEPLSEDQDHLIRPIPGADEFPDGDFLLLVTEEDCGPESLLPRPAAGILGLVASNARSPLEVSPLVQSFANGAVADALGRAGYVGQPAEISGDWATQIIEAAKQAQTDNVVTSYAPVGPVASHLQRAKSVLNKYGIDLRQVRRGYDDLAWPHATKGFFGLKKRIPRMLVDLGLST